MTDQSENMRYVSLARLPSIEKSPCEELVPILSPKGRATTRLVRCPHYARCAENLTVCQDFFRWTQRGGRVTHTAKVLVDGAEWINSDEDEAVQWIWTDTGLIKRRVQEAA